MVEGETYGSEIEILSTGNCERKQVLCRPYLFTTLDKLTREPGRARGEMEKHPDNEQVSNKDKALASYLKNETKTR